LNKYDLSQTKWTYSASRDRTMWLLIAAGAAGAVPAVILLPASWYVAGAASRSGVGGALWPVLLFVPTAGLTLWAIVWWALAARRVRRMRRLTHSGVPVEATVEKIKLLRGKNQAMIGAVFWLQYALDGRTYLAKKRTTLAGVAGKARESKRLELAVDPRAPSISALGVEGKLA
jgi:hypothetical protein